MSEREDDEMELDRREFLADSLIVSAAAASWWGLSLKSDALANSQAERTVPVSLPDPEDHSSHYSYNH